MCNSHMISSYQRYFQCIGEADGISLPSARQIFQISHVLHSQVFSGKPPCYNKEQMREAAYQPGTGEKRMGQFVNPGNDNFTKEIHADIYVDKTGLISFTNHVMNTPGMFICSSRPRRFGKSYGADMLAAYYSKGCDSGKLFAPYRIAESPDYKKNLNRCDVIRFDVQWCMSDAGSPEKTVDYINRQIIREMKAEYPEADLSETRTVFGAMNILNAKLGKSFVVIIDEWDALIRDDANDPWVQNEYINFLRGMFKGTEPMKFIELAYITGILPVKRLRTQSSLNNFYEYTMIAPGALAEYIGFTDSEVRELCGRYNMNYEDVRKWYDGYFLGEYHIYNPNSVCKCMHSRQESNFWTATASFESVRSYINMDFDGLKTALIEMISGARVKINVNTFENHTDRTAFKSKDDVFTYMVHLGYLAYDPVRKEAYVPSEEIRQELGAGVSESRWSEFDSFEKESDEILSATLAPEEDKVAGMLEKIHERYASSIWYNNENSLAAVITIAYLSTLKYYFKPLREMPAGKGFADIVYLPRPEYLGDLPALIVELKWNKTVRTALDQIRQRNYSDGIREYTGDILLVCVNYDRKTKKHTCQIERMEK